MSVTSGKKAQIYIPAIPSVPLTVPEPTTASDLTNYQINNTAHRYLDKQLPFTLEFSTGGAWNPVVNSGTSAYTIQWIGGWVRFGVAQPANTVIRFSSGNYFTMAAAGNARSAKMSSKANLLETTDFTFGAVGGKHFDATQVESTWTLTRWYFDSFFHDNADQLMVLVLYANVVTGSRFESYARLTDDSIDVAVTGMVDHPLTFKGEGSWIAIP